MGGVLMPTNALLIKHENGWAERTATADPERIEALLALGALTSLPEVYRVADVQLDIFARFREQVTVGLSPVATKLPYSGYNVGDTVVVPRALGGTSTERVQAITVTEDNGTGEPTFTIDIKDVLVEADEAFDLAVKKMSNGTMGGAVSPAQPAVPLYITPSTS
jgi:hypothetical protein